MPSRTVFDHRFECLVDVYGSGIFPPLVRLLFCDLNGRTPALLIVHGVLDGPAGWVNDMMMQVLTPQHVRGVQFHAARSILELEVALPAYLRREDFPGSPTTAPVSISLASSVVGNASKEAWAAASLEYVQSIRAHAGAGLGGGGGVGAAAAPHHAPPLALRHPYHPGHGPPPPAQPLPQPGRQPQRGAPSPEASSAMHSIGPPSPAAFSASPAAYGGGGGGGPEPRDAGLGQFAYYGSAPPHPSGSPPAPWEEGGLGAQQYAYGGHGMPGPGPMSGGGSEQYRSGGGGGGVMEVRRVSGGTGGGPGRGAPLPYPPDGGPSSGPSGPPLSIRATPPLRGYAGHPQPGSGLLGGGGSRASSRSPRVWESEDEEDCERSGATVGSGGYPPQPFGGRRGPGVSPDPYLLSGGGGSSHYASGGGRNRAPSSGGLGPGGFPPEPQGPYPPARPSQHSSHSQQAAAGDYPGAGGDGAGTATPPAAAGDAASDSITRLLSLTTTTKAERQGMSRREYRRLLLQQHLTAFQPGEGTALSSPSDSGGGGGGDLEQRGMDALVSGVLNAGGLSPAPGFGSPYAPAPGAGSSSVQMGGSGLLDALAPSPAIVAANAPGGVANPLGLRGPYRGPAASPDPAPLAAAAAAAAPPHHRGGVGLPVEGGASSATAAGLAYQLSARLALSGSAATPGNSRGGLRIAASSAASTVTSGTSSADQSPYGASGGGNGGGGGTPVDTSVSAAIQGLSRLPIGAGPGELPGHPGGLFGNPRGEPPPPPPLQQQQQPWVSYSMAAANPTAALPGPVASPLSVLSPNSPHPPVQEGGWDAAAAHGTPSRAGATAAATTVSGGGMPSVDWVGDRAQPP